MIIVSNAVCLLMIAAGVFDKLSGFLSALGIVMMGFIALAIADFYLVRRGRPRSGDAEAVDWAGVGTLVVASAIGYALSATGVFPFGFVTSTVLVLIGYPLVRLLLPAREPAPSPATVSAG
jgi:cytosine permease